MIMFIHKYETLFTSRLPWIWVFAICIQKCSSALGSGYAVFKLYKLHDPAEAGLRLRQLADPQPARPA